MNLQSPKIVVNHSQKIVFDFLSDLNNFKQLMPLSLEFFESNATSFSFKLNGLPKVFMKIKEKRPNHQVLLEANGGRFEFELLCNINKVNETQSEIEFLFEGTFNSLMKMMVKQPLQNLLKTFSDKIASI